MSASRPPRFELPPQGSSGDGVASPVRPSGSRVARAQGGSRRKKSALEESWDSLSVFTSHNMSRMEIAAQVSPTKPSVGVEDSTEFGDLLDNAIAASRQPEPEVSWCLGFCGPCVCNGPSVRCVRLACSSTPCWSWRMNSRRRRKSAWKSRRSPAGGGSRSISSPHGGTSTMRGSPGLSSSTAMGARSSWAPRRCAATGHCKPCMTDI